MAVLDLLIYPDSRLKTISSPVESFDKKLLDFITDLEDTIAAAPGSVGIAAPQVGEFKRIVIVDVSTKANIKHHGHLRLINPEIVHWKGFAVGREGCMSVPDYIGNVVRAKNIKLLAMDEYGIQHEYEMTGYEARAVQHEIDHLEGMLFLDRLVSRRHDLLQRENRHLS
ncbi:peptide deformylase [Candidatus Halobeggiatoa sp. HSG11]|nr:peptide deformylase [Candidatus Halobeggiatoa sp. HSG11]